LKAAVIDVGYNSLKMVKYRIDTDGSVNPYGQFGVMARLGQDLEKTGFIGKEPMERTVEAIRLCSEIAAMESIKYVLLIGTSPLREAANRDEFLLRAEEEAGLTMRVLTGNEEALYALLGAARSVPAETALFFDLGGGSLELVYADKGAVKRIMSLPLGSLKLTNLYADKDGLFNRKNRARMSKEILDFLPTRSELGLAKDTALVGTGGTVRAMARYDQETVGYPLNKVHNYGVTIEAVEGMSKKFFELKVGELGKVDAIGEDRAETMAAGATVVRLLMKRLNFQRTLVSTHGIRDGVITEFLEGGMQFRDEVLPKDEVERLLRPRELPVRFADNVELANCMVRNDLIDGRQKSILLKALERGRSSDCIQANPDSLFWIAMGEDLPMSHEDQLLLAITLVRARRSRTANWLLERFGPLMARDDPRSVRRMGAALRLMEVLDRSSARFVTSFSGGLRVGVMASDSPFPLGLAKTSAATLSQAIKKPVSVSLSQKVKIRQMKLVKPGE